MISYSISSSLYPSISSVSGSKIVTNAIGERVLRRSDLCISRKESMANDAAVDVISEYFNTGDESVISGFRLEDTRQSLEALWMVDT